MAYDSFLLIKGTEIDLNWKDGIDWYFQLGVAGGKRTYWGVDSYPNPTDDESIYFAVSMYEQSTFQALKNYHRAIGACLSALELGLSFDAFKNKLSGLYEALRWYQVAWRKYPDNNVLLDWCDQVQGMKEKSIKEWDSPNEIFNYYIQLEKDCKKLLSKKITLDELKAKYK